MLARHGSTCVMRLRIQGRPFLKKNIDSIQRNSIQWRTVINGNHQTFLSRQTAPKQVNKVNDLAPPDNVSLEETWAGNSSPQPLQVDLSDASGTDLSKETGHVLQGRLRLASLVMFGGFSAYLALNLFLTNWSASEFGWLFVAHVVLTFVLGLCALTLCRQCHYSTTTLRTMELMVFGGSAAFFFAMTTLVSRESVIQDGFIPELVSVWIILMFVYALFIPNTWQRAGIVIGSIACIRIALTIHLIYFDSISSQAVNANFQIVSQTILILAVCAVGATVGVYTIGSLRREAFRAKQLGQYQLRHSLGRGGMGEVFLAEHQLMKRPCAIKVIRPEMASDSQALARFEREVRATAALSHWNTIDIYDYGHDQQGTFYYVMEYLPGMNLGDIVKQFGPMPASRVIHLLRQTCGALGEAHQAGLIHRDIKPANIFAAQRGGYQDVAKLLDFGLVKPISKTVNLDLSNDGMVTGSPLYMSPEQAVGDEPDVRSDIYALGAVAYYLSTGQPPFSYDKPMKVLMAHAHESPLPMSKLVADVPRDYQQVVMRCLAKDPSDRYQSASELEQAFSKCADGNRWTDVDAASWWKANDLKTATTHQTATASPVV